MADNDAVARLRSAGVALRDRGQYEQALARFTDALALDPIAEPGAAELDVVPDAGVVRVQRERIGEAGQRLFVLSAVA